MRPGRIAYLLLAVSGLTALAVAYGMNPPGAPDDNFLAYKTKISKGTPKFQPRLGLHLVDAWEDQFYDAGAAAGLFVPATANGQGIADAETYLQAYKIKALRGYRHTKRSGVLVTNEVGTISLDTKGRDLLLVPTAEDLDSSPSSPNPQFHNVDHFKCYRVGVTKGTAPFPRGISISVDDQLATDERRLALTRPQHLCVPVDKNDEGIKNPTGLLLCYAAKLLPGAPKHQRQLSLRINNQFGPLTLDSVKETEFCVPSVSGGVPTPMATQAPTPTPAQAGCGDGSLQANEVCDVGVLSGQNCSSLGYVGGALSCARTCNGFDSSNCTLPASPPSDPTLSAPPLDPSVAMDIKTASSFLYSGASRVQYGVTADTIEAIRAAVLRGSVSTQDGAPLAGVVVSIHGHPEFGQAVTRTDGRFDLVVNGGGALSVDYKKPGFLISQRHVAVPWQEYTEVPPVGMVAKDPIATQVNLRGNSTAMQVALGSTRSDSRGSRTAVVMFPRGTRASIIEPDGSSQLVQSLSIRLTEYTVGANNTAAMPAALPSLTSYTYAVELGADEAVTKVGGHDVVFDRPVVSYTDNFIDLPVGLDIPAGYYDRDAAAWIPSRNGRVIKIVGVAGELAKIDLTGSGEAASDAALEEIGIDTDERRELAGRYAIGKSLWRVPLTHFSTYDFNYGSQPKPPPPHPDPQPKPNPDDPCQSPHSSTIECQTQVLKEEVPIAGTPYTLNYSSSRVPAYAPPIAIPLTGSAVSSAALRVELEINVAGQKIRKDFAPNPDQTYDFQWDGRDGYGRMVQGTTRVEATVGLVYPRTYLSPLALFGTSAFGDYPSNQPILAHNADGEQVEVRTYHYQVTNWDARGIGLGGWMLNRHHAYDSSGRTLLLGSGARRSAADSNLVIRTYAGGGTGGDGSSRRAASLDDVSAVAEGPDGSVYVGTYRAGIIRRISPTGIVGIFAGGHGLGFSGDGGRARDAQLGHIWDLATGPDGSIYLLESSIEAPGANRIRRITSEGIISTVVGGAVNAFYGDGGPATAAAISNAYGIDVGRDGSIFVADTHNHRIRRIGPDGIIATIAGTGVAGFSGDGGAARTAQMYFPRDVAVSADGDVFFDDDANLRIRRIARDGTITTVVGDGTCCFNGDERPATQAKLGGQLGSLSIGRDGTLYISDAIANRRVRFVGPDQIIHTLAGNGGLALPVDGDTAAAAAVLHGFRNFPSNDGGVFVISGPYAVDGRVYKVAPTYPGFDAGDIAIPADDGEELFRFSAAGRHLSTVNTRTGATVLSFGYSAAGELVSIADGDGNITTIEHDPAGHPTAIVSPYGQRTVLSTDGSGFLNRIENSAGEAYLPTHSAGGLLLGVTNPRGYASVYAYDTAGRLIRAEDAAGGSKTLTRVDPPASESDGSNYEVTLRTALNRTTTYKSQTGAVGPLIRSSFRYLMTNTAPDGAVTQTWERYDGRSETAAPDGTSTTTVRGPDPRFGMQAGLDALSTTVTPGGLTLSIANERAVALADPADPLSLVSQTDTRTINGNRARRVYTSATRTFSFLSPENRQASSTIDELGRVVRVQTAGLWPTDLSYDARGRLASVVQGAGVDERRITFTYNAEGFLASLTDPLNRTTSFEYDAVGRLTKQVLPDLREVSFGYDPNGNVTSVTPPGRPVHSLSYTPLDLEATYDPPLGNGPEGAMVYAYDRDRQLDLVTRPDGREVDYVYDAGGRLSRINAASGETSYSYDSVGRIENIAAPDGEGLAYTYDGNLRTSTTWSGTVNGRVSRTYDNDFRVTSITVNDTDTVTFDYDGDGLLTRAGQMTIMRDPANGLVTETSLGNVADSWTYNGFGEPLHYTVRYSGGVIYELQLTRDKLGRITQKAEIVAGVSHTYDYEYDPAGRLWKVTEDGVLKTPYTYDVNGNRLTAPGLTSTPVYDDQDRLLEYDGTSYGYTANGELMAATVGGETTSYDYDVFGNLRALNLPGAEEAKYVVDGSGRRIGRKLNGLLVQGVLYQDGVRPIAELDGSGAVVSRFVYGSSANVPSYLLKGGAVYRVIADHLGSPRLVVNVASGSVGQRMRHDEFGNVVQDSAPGFQPFGFAGGVPDPSSHLTRFGARDYAPNLGRWTVREPLLFEGGDSNLYNYAYSDPINVVDRDGRTPSVKQIAQMANRALMKTIRSLRRLIAEHKEKLADPCDLARQHHEHELALFEQRLAQAEAEAARRNILENLGAAGPGVDEDAVDTPLQDMLDPFGPVSGGNAY